MTPFAASDMKNGPPKLLFFVVNSFTSAYPYNKDSVPSPPPFHFQLLPNPNILPLLFVMPGSSSRTIALSVQSFPGYTDCLLSCCLGIVVLQGSPSGPLRNQTFVQIASLDTCLFLPLHPAWRLRRRSFCPMPLCCV